MSSKRKFIVSVVNENYEQYEVEAEDMDEAIQLVREEDDSIIHIESGYITGGEQYHAYPLDGVYK